MKGLSIKHIVAMVLLINLFALPTIAQENDSITVEPTAMCDSIVDELSTTNKPSLVDRVVDWYTNNMNYGSITALMTVESSFIPFPSEVVIPPAAYVAASEESTLYKTDNYLVNILLVVLFGTLGALIGALINYGLSIWLGRPIIYAFADSKVGHLLLLSSEKIKKAEAYFNEHGKTSTFFGRFIPAIRQLISIPAGLARMNIWSFILYTSLGAFLWNCILALLGYLAQGQSDLINKYSHELSIALIGIVVIAALVIIIRYAIKKRKHKQS